MKHMLKISALALAIIMVYSCQQSDMIRPKLENVPSEILDKIDALGFNSNEVKMYDGKLFIEGDIMISVDELYQLQPDNALPVEEHYSTDNLVAGTPRTISVYVNMAQRYLDATDIAISDYNDENLTITFERVTSSGSADITISASPWYYYWFGILGSAGFPTASGDPHDLIYMTTEYYDDVNNINGIATTISHEIGHAIGFRHTDYMDRSYSCGGSTNDEGDGGVGDNHIPGTPTTADANSWMLACGSPELSRPFTANDKIALDYLY